MFDFFKKKSGAKLGLDIGTSSLKAVQLNKQGTDYKLENYGFLDLFFPCSNGDLIACESTDTLQEKRLIALLKAFIKKGNFNTKGVVISVPVFSSFFTAISLPFMPEQELEGAIRYEAKKYVPLPLEDVELDWLISNNQMLAFRNYSKNHKQKTKTPYETLDILLAAVPKELIQRLSRIVAALGLNLIALEAESFSLIRSLEYQAMLLNQQLKKQEQEQKKRVPQDKSIESYLVLDGGARSTSLAWLESGGIQLVHFIDYSGNRVSNFLSERLRLSFNQIEMAKRGQRFLGQKERKFDFVVGEQEVRYLYPVFEKVVSEIRAVIASGQKPGGSRKRPLNKPRFCIVSGGSVYLSGFLSYLSKNLDIPVVRANPFLGLQTPSSLRTCLKDIGPLMGVAVGLALR